jgi:hypothetical protein
MNKHITQITAGSQQSTYFTVTNQHLCDAVVKSTYQPATARQQQSTNHVHAKNSRLQPFARAPDCHKPAPVGSLCHDEVTSQQQCSSNASEK